MSCCVEIQRRTAQWACRDRLERGRGGDASCGGDATRGGDGADLERDRRLDVNGHGDLFGVRAARDGLEPCIEPRMHRIGVGARGEDRLADGTVTQSPQVCIVLRAHTVCGDEGVVAPVTGLTHCCVDGGGRAKAGDNKVGRSERAQGRIERCAAERSRTSRFGQGDRCVRQGPRRHVDGWLACRCGAARRTDDKVHAGSASRCAQLRKLGHPRYDLAVGEIELAGEIEAQECSTRRTKVARFERPRIGARTIARDDEQMAVLITPDTLRGCPPLQLVNKAARVACELGTETHQTSLTDGLLHRIPDV